MRSITYVEPIYFAYLRLLLRIILAHDPLAIRVMGIVLLGVCLLLLASATVSPTFGMNTSCISALFLVMLFMLEVCQGLGLCDGFVYGFDLTLLQLCLGAILQCVHEVEQHVSYVRLGI